MPLPLFLDLHAVQSIPVANLNRDDLGSPKRAKYGNASRLRVSSQSWKREIRHGIEEELGEHAARSRLVPKKVAAALGAAGWPAQLAAFAGDQVAHSVGKKGIGLDSPGRTNVLLYVPEAAITELAAVCEKHRTTLEQAAQTAENAEKAKKNKNTAPAPVLPAQAIEAILKRRTASISLLGRMLAEMPDANVDGAAQVAHAITTHASEPQRDYFTAVDDWLGEAETGSGHLDNAEFSAGVLYRYATLNLRDLVKNLEGDTKLARTVAGAFADHFLMSLPQAKKNSTAPHTIPDLAHLAVRARRPMSYAAAFETPVAPSSAGGFSATSRTAVDAYAGGINRLTGRRGLRFHGHASIDESALEHLGTRFESFPDLIDAAVDAALPEDSGQDAEGPQ